jgi:O-antigen/teichoic acid export membrane protein
MVEDFGLDSILVQDRSIQGRQQARLAGLIIATGVVFCLAFLALAHSIAGFFKEPQVAGAIGALSLLFITDALQVVPRATLQRELEFRRFAALTLVQVVATQAVLIAAATAGWGFRSLVASSLAGAIAVTATLIFWRPYAVAWPRELASLARPLLQGWRVIAGRIAYYFFTSGDQWIVGRMLGKDALGIYTFAQTFGNLPLQEVTAIVSRVVPGVFSESQKDRARLRHYFLLLTRFVACLTVPLAIGLALTADLVVHLALGPKWESVIAPLRLLCLYIGIALVWVVLYPIANMPALILGLQTVSVSIRGWLAALSPSLFAAFAMTVAVLIVRRVLPAYPVPVTLALVSGSGAVVYAAVLWFGFRRETLEMVDFVRNVRGRRAQAAPAPVNP